MDTYTIRKIDARRLMITATSPGKQSGGHFFSERCGWVSFSWVFACVRDRDRYCCKDSRTSV